MKEIKEAFQGKLWKKIVKANTCIAQKCGKGFGKRNYEKNHASFLIEVSMLTNDIDEFARNIDKFTLESK